MEGETLYCFTIGKLRDLLVQEGVYLQALRGPVDGLIEMLTRMEELLEYARVRRDKRTTEIIELADHLIDSIETYVYRLLTDYMGIRVRFLRPKVLMAIEKITTKINELVKSQSGVQSNDVEAPRREYKVQDLSGFNENDFVGRVEDINKLASFLVDEVDEQFQVISLYGMGGLGKTTLARKVYRDEKVLGYFQSFAFVCVSEQCQEEEILKHILQQLLPGKKEEDIKGMSAGDVIESLQRVQGEKKCLVVIDDVWSVCDWERLNRGLPDGCTGSKVLLTTRIKDVADKGFCYSLKCLSEEECWNLFQKKIFTGRDPQVQRMEELGKKMIAWCRGIPLAVLVLRGVLVTKGSPREWERFYESRKWGVKEHEQFKGEIVQELLFSYKELPYPLRPCFLYLSNFHEDEEIEPEMLYRLWDAEGMILSKDRKEGETMMDVAERYLGDLVGRSMVEAKLQEEVDSSVRRRYKSCRVHDLLRQLCLSIVQKENFLKVHDQRDVKDKVVVPKPSHLGNGTRMPARQTFYFSLATDFSVQGKKEAKRYVRSLMFEGGCARNLWNLKKFKFLRVLSLYDTSTGKEDFTNELIHLRYFSLRWCRIRKSPSSMRNLMYLQTLDIRVDLRFPFVLSIPKLAMKNFKRLRHLFLPYVDCYKVMPKFSKLRLDGLTELETLVNLDSTKCEMKDVIQLKNLRRLEWRVHISSEDDGEESKGIMNKVNLDPSRHSSLGIVLENPEIEIYSDVLRGQLPEYYQDILRELTIFGAGGKLSPEFSNFCQLTELTLQDFEVEEDPMLTLEKLSNLKFLTLCKGELNKKEMACSTMGFPQLRYLLFSSLKNWEKWRVEEGAMPKLRLLFISECEKLEMLPDGLRFITSIDHLEVRGMPEEFKRRLIGGAEGGGEEGEDFYKIRHVRDVEISVE